MCVSSNFPKDKSDPTSHFCSYKLLQSSHDPLIKTENLTNMTFRIIYYLVLAYFSRLTSSLLHLSHSKRHVITAAAAAKLHESCPTLCDSIDCSPPGTPIPGILQARTLEWVAISFSNAWKWKVKVKSLSHVQLFATPRTAAHQAPPSMGFFRQEYWSGASSPSPVITAIHLQILVSVSKRSLSPFSTSYWSRLRSNINFSRRVIHIIF